MTNNKKKLIAHANERTRVRVPGDRPGRRRRISLIAAAYVIARVSPPSKICAREASLVINRIPFASPSGGRVTVPPPLSRGEGDRSACQSFARHARRVKVACARGYPIDISNGAERMRGTLARVRARRTVHTIRQTETHVYVTCRGLAWP